MLCAGKSRHVVTFAVASLVHLLSPSQQVLSDDDRRREYDRQLSPRCSGHVFSESSCEGFFRKEFLPNSTFHFVYILLKLISPTSFTSPTSSTSASSKSHTSSSSSSASFTSTSHLCHTHHVQQRLLEVLNPNISLAKLLQCHVRKNCFSSFQTSLHRSCYTGVLMQELFYRRCYTEVKT